MVGGRSALGPGGLVAGGAIYSSTSASHGFEAGEAGGMVVVERPNIVVTTLVRAGMIRVPERHRAWLARELLVQAARRRTAIAGLLPSALVFTAMWPLLDSFGSHRGPPAWMWLSVPVASVVLGVLGFGYDRQARYLRTRNRLATEEPGGASASVTGRRRGG